MGTEALIGGICFILKMYKIETQAGQNTSTKITLIQSYVGAP